MLIYAQSGLGMQIEMQSYFYFMLGNMGMACEVSIDERVPLRCDAGYTRHGRGMTICSINTIFHGDGAVSSRVEFESKDWLVSYQSSFTVEVT